MYFLLLLVVWLFVDIKALIITQGTAERVSFIRFHQKCFDFEIKKKAGEDAFVLDCFVLVTYRSVLV